MRWFWSVTAIVPAIRGVTSATAATREAAMAKFWAAWEKACQLPKAHRSGHHFTLDAADRFLNISRSSGRRCLATYECCSKITRCD
jgi:hypothetical protein